MSLDKTREDLHEEKRILQEEKERFTEATIRLNREVSRFRIHTEVIVTVTFGMKLKMRKI